jgi:uncharacterized membrane protein YphA (DoxX/SURF4 family)
MLVLLRIMVGSVFFVSGLEKALGPSGNFLYVIQAYQILPLALAKIAAVAFPWVELFLGLFLILGLWLPWVLRGVLCMSGTLILVVAQALLRRLPMDNCGCFGDLIHLRPEQVIFLDLAILIVAAACLWKPAAASLFSLDLFYSRQRK